MNASEHLRATAQAKGDEIALIEVRGKRRQVTWSEFDEAVDTVARSLTARGYVAGHRVALVMSNRIDLAIAYYGVLRGGLVAVPINPRSSVREIERMINGSKARVVMCDEVAIDDVRAVAKSADEPLLVCVAQVRARGAEETFTDFLRRADGPAPVAPADPEALAVLLYTSGTSGKPRAAMLPHRALIANVEQIARLDPPPMTGDDTCLALLPLFHIYGLNAILGQAVRQGARTVLVDGFDSDATLDLIDELSITNLPIAPPVIAAWAGRDDARAKLSSVRHIMSGAAPLDPDLADAFYASSGQYVDQGYGLTETAPVVSTTLGSQASDDGSPKRGSVGRPLPGIDVRIVEVSGNDASAGDPAEIWVRGDNLFLGYWPDATDGPDDDGWYPTGDIGFVDADGDLTLVDRLKELVIVSGFNVYPTEVEETIAEVPGVSQVAVVGVPDEETGEAVRAFVVPFEDVGPKENELKAQIQAACEARLARFKWPKSIVMVQGLPHSVTGKVAKGRLRSLARSHDLGLD